MKKLIYCILVVSLIGAFLAASSDTLKAQVSKYVFSTSVEPYTEITGGTLLGQATDVDLENSLTFQLFSGSIPFRFYMHGIPETTYTVSTNNFISFGNMPLDGEFSPISSGETYRAAIAPLSFVCSGIYKTSGNLSSGSNVITNVVSQVGIVTGKKIVGANIPDGTTISSFDPTAQTITMSNPASGTLNGTLLYVASGEIRAQTIGTAPSRIHVIQFKNMCDQSSGTGFYTCYNFQIRLKETSNVIEFAYGFSATTTSTRVAQVGLRGKNNTDFNNRMGGAWNNPQPGIANNSTMRLDTTIWSTGRTFTFSPIDAGVTSILAPAEMLSTCSQIIAPKATIQNFGPDDVLLSSTCQITGPVNYSSSKNFLVNKNTTITGRFDSTFVPNTPGTYNMKVIVSLLNDVNHSNDTLYSSFTISEQNFGGGAAQNNNYYFANSTICAGSSIIQPVFQWADTTGSSNLILNRTVMAPSILNGSIDDGHFKLGNVLPSGYKFRYGGVNYDSFFISTNGIIGFTETGNSQFHNSAQPFSLPLVNAAKPAVFAFWKDLDFSDVDVPVNRLSYRYNSSLKKLIITYDRAPNYNTGADTSDYISFQVLLDVQLSPAVDGKITIQFDDSKTGSSFLSKYNNNTLAHHTVGIQDQTGTKAIQYRYRSLTTLVTPGLLFSSPLAISFGKFLAAPSLTLPSNGASNQMVTPQFTWSSVTDALNYHIQIARDSMFASIVYNDSSLTSTAFNIPAGILQNANAYYWRVKGKNSTTEAAYSSVYKFSTSSSAGMALDFDGVNDHITVPDLPGINNFSSTLKFSVEFWCRVNSNTGNFTFVNKGGGAGNEQYSIDIFGNDLRFYVKSVTGVFTVTSIPKITVADGWTHIAATFDRSQSIMALYKNGVQVAAAVPPPTLNSNTNPLAIGAQAVPLDQFLFGEMDNVRLWNHARTPGEIQDNMNCEIFLPVEGLVANYPFNHGNAAANNTGFSMLVDQSGYGNNGTLNGFALTGVTSNWIAPGGATGICGPGEALIFDGVNDNVAIPNSSDMNNFSSIMKFTIEFRCKVNSNTGDFTFINKGGGGGLEQYSIDMVGSNLRYYVKDAAGAFTFIQVPRLTVQDGWVHIAATFDMFNSAMNLYKNGVLVGTAVPPITLNSNTNPLSIGVQAISGIQPLNGSMDEIRLWNYARSQAQIQNEMNCEIPGPTFGLTANYNFNQGIAWGINTGINTLTDVSGNGNNGALNNFTLSGTASNWISPGGIIPGSICDPKTSFIDIKIIPEGYYDNSTKRLRMRDTVRAILRESVPPFNIVDSSKAVIDSVNYTGSFTFSASAGTYYIQIRHRNTIDTWSKNGVPVIPGSSISYNFTDSLQKAFGNNLKQVDIAPVRFGIFSGDINKDAAVNLTDVVSTFNDATSFASGYINTDVTGNSTVDLSDLVRIFNNSNSFVSVISP